MLKSSTRYKIDKYLQMARLTDDEETRNLWLRKAWHLLENTDDVLANDTTTMFIASCVVKQSKEKVTRSALYKAYAEWCKKWRYIPSSRNALYSALREAGYLEWRETNGRYFLASIEADDETPTF